MESASDSSPAVSTNVGMIALLFASVLAASANTVLFKIALNSFSSPTTNYGFFVSQFSTLLYTFQAIAVSAILIYRDRSDKLDMSLQKQPVYVYMGSLDAASATLAAIAGVACPGELQTVLNQMVIPITMVCAVFILGTSFESYQIWGSTLILLGTVLASSDYFLPSSSSEHTDDAPQVGEMVLTASIVLYFISVIPSALSNIYKERKMKELDMNEVHTSTIVSFWQLWIGFVFLPLMALPQLGGLSYDEMKSQLSDGFMCFRGTNPRDPSDTGCSSAALWLMIYVILNFIYNIMMLAITKKGSAVLLVTSQALSLPLTNIAFTLKPLMGSDAEPLSLLDLAGLALVCIGFVAYCGFGFAHNFMVAQGPPGQMAYAHFEDHDEIIVSSKVATEPEELAIFVVSAVLESYRLKQESMARSFSKADTQLLLDAGDLGEATGEKSSENLGLLDIENNNQHLRRRQRTRSGVNMEHLSKIDATQVALDVLRKATVVLENKLSSLHEGDSQVVISSPNIRFKPSRTNNSDVKQRQYGSLE